MANLSGISNQSLIGKLLRAPLRLIPRTAVLPILQGVSAARQEMDGRFRLPRLLVGKL